MKTLNKVALTFIMLTAFLFSSADIEAQCVYDLDQLKFTENSTSVYIYPFGGSTGEFTVQWRTKGVGAWNVSGLISSHVWTMADEPLEECTKYEFCIREKCGPNDWSELSDTVCVMTLCECPCDEPIEITTEAQAFEFSAHLYAYGYEDYPHYFEYWPIDPDAPGTITPIFTGHAITVDDLEPCRKYAYRLIVYCPQYPECPDACEYTEEARWSEIDTFMTTGCKETDPIGPVECCDYLFVVDKSGSMSNSDLAEAECQIQNFINQVQEACPEECGATFAITTWQERDDESEVVNNFECDPVVDLGDRTPGEDDIGNAADQIADWLGNGTIDPDLDGEHKKCLHVIIYTDAGCNFYEGFNEGVDHIIEAGATSVSLVAFENHGCEGAEDAVQGTGGVYTESSAGDCVPNEGLQSGESSIRSTAQYDPNNANVLIEEMPKKRSTVSKNLTIYPMPFTDVFNIQCQLENESDIRVELYNTLGSLVYKTTSKNQSKGNHTLSIDTSLPQGTYTYKIDFDGKTFTGNIIKI